MTNTRSLDIEVQFIQCLVKPEHLFGDFALSLESLSQWFKVSKLEESILTDWLQAFGNLEALPNRSLNGVIDGLFNLDKFNPNEFRRGLTFVDFMENVEETTLYSALWNKYKIN